MSEIQDQEQAKAFSSKEKVYTYSKKVSDTYTEEQYVYLKNLAKVYQEQRNRYREERDEAEKKLIQAEHKLQHASVTELGADNVNVASYCDHWEGRVIKAEADLELKTRQNQANIGYLKERDAEIERLRVQLAGCSVAACGGTKSPAEQGDYGWSVAYQDVLDLQNRFNTCFNAQVKYITDKLKELDQVTEQLKDSNDRANQLSGWLNEAAKLLGCDLDQVAKCILRNKPVSPMNVEMQDGISLYTKHIDFSIEATAQLIYYLGEMFNEMNDGLWGDVKQLVRFRPEIKGKTFRNLQRAWERSAFSKQAQDWE